MPFLTQKGLVSRRLQKIHGLFISREAAKIAKNEKEGRTFAGTNCGSGGLRHFRHDPPSPGYGGHGKTQ
jgi:hypothetical protein